MIARAADDALLAREHLRHALAFSLAFDPRQVGIARQALGELEAMASSPHPTTSTADHSTGPVPES